MIVGSKTLEYLSFGQVVKRLCEFASTPMGLVEAGQAGVLADAAVVPEELARVDELRAVMAVGDQPDFSGIEEVDSLLERAVKEGTLQATDLLVLGDCARGVSRIHSFGQSHSRELSHSVDLLAHLHDLRELAGRISSCIDRDGRLNDNASPALRELRSSANTAHMALKDRLEDFLKSREAEDLLQDKFYTLREDRYVVPVRAERKSTLEGIVHGVSQTGATVFLEPRFLISLNNRLKLVQEEVRREEYAVLSGLSEEVAEEVPRFRESLKVVGRLDYLCARARLALAMDASRPQVGLEPRVSLLGARFPQLVLSGQPVVPNDVALGLDYSLLVLSGPNAGGKSVALKTLGQCLLMVRCGLLIPASPDSYVPLLDGLHALPGDLEDVSMQLSTFTGHLEALNRALEVVDGRHLVLIDEITVGTEPEQGSALGAAYLQEFADTGALVVVATHYERLKALAMGDSRFENAAMGMDSEDLSPTYRLAIGTPGSSSTLEIAERCRVPQGVLKRAHDLLEGRQGNLLEDAIRKLALRERELARMVSQQEEAVFEAEQLKRRRALALEQLGKQSHIVIERKVREGMVEVDEALALVSSLEAQLQRARPDHQELKRTRKTLNEVRERLHQRASSLEADETGREFAAQRASRFEVGGEVLVKKFKKKAVVVSLSDKDGSASLKMGPMRLSLPLSDLVPLAAGEKPGPTPRRVVSVVPAESPTRLDLRGAYTEDGVVQVQKALDQGMLSPGGPLVVVHGHGTGRLKAAVRDYLKSSSYPIRFRSGKREEGGDGVTIVEFESA